MYVDANTISPVELALPAPGCLPTRWALLIEAIIVSGMVLIAVIHRRASNGTARNGLYWLAGLLLVTSTFFVHGYGAMGGTYAPYVSLTWHWGFPKLLHATPSIWPQLFGVVVMFAAFYATVNKNLNSRKIHWLVVGGFIVIVGMSFCALLLTLLLGSSVQAQPSLRGTVLIGVQAIVCLLVFVFCLFSKESDEKKKTIVHLVGAVSMWYVLIPPISSILQGHSLSMYRFGYWLMFTGVILMLGSSIRGLAQRQSQRSDECAKCGYSLRTNVSGICPECGTPISAEQRKMIASAIPREIKRDAAHFDDCAISKQDSHPNSMQGH